ncbi:MAG TPA: hypothetical protein VGH72_00085, partial [Pseudonocardia sp.]
LQSGGPGMDPRIVTMEQQGPAGLISLWQQLHVEVEAQAYSNVFLIAGICTLGGVVLAFFLRHGKAVDTGDTEPVEVG